MRALVLALAMFCGSPAMTPEQVEELLSQLKEPKIAHTLPERSDGGDDLEEYLRSHGLK